jgi:peptidoglycan/LPS O-acetylase OafA/YrhL
LVILDHLMILYGAESTPFGKFGVYLFFAISGYIITRLLVLERASSGGIDLQAFWIRRVARIVPPFMLYTVIVLVLVAFGAAGPEVTGQAAQAITFTCNINVGPGCGWLFGHTWSLAFEEQFYLVFPLLLAGFRRWLILPLVLLWAAPFVFPLHFIGKIGFIQIMLLLGLGAIYGTWELRLRPLLQRIPNVLVLASPALCVAWLALPPSLLQAATGVILPLGIVLTLFGLTLKFPPIRWLLETPPFVSLGVWSYSLYLWQQLFTAKWAWNNGLMPLLGIAAATAIAAVSYRTIEKTSGRLGRTLIVRMRSARSTK